MADTDQIKELLGSGLSHEVVATAVGCSPSYISQLMAEEDFSSEVALLRTRVLTAQNTRDRGIDSLEDRVLSKLGEVIDYVHKPMDLLRFMQVLNAARRRGVPAQESVVVNQQIVNLQIPTKILQHFATNRTGEVIEVGDKSVVTMPAQQLLGTLAAQSTEHKDQQTYARISNYLPQLSSAAAKGKN